MNPKIAIAADGPISCAIYARENGLLSKEEWKRFKRTAFEQQQMFCVINKAKIKSYHASPKFKYGFEIPRDYNYVVKLDHQNGNTNWQHIVINVVMGVSLLWPHDSKLSHNGVHEEHDFITNILEDCWKRMQQALLCCLIS